ncbi:MAG TPA: SBBP repeat-containing protein, partial [Polyangia bacterium]|nr:SBBP repeat-containing protein [Polyangia bacterium]
MKQHGDGCRSVADSLGRALATLVAATLVATAGVGCGGSDESRRGAGTATTGTGGGNATAGAQNGQGGTGGTVDPAAAPGATIFARQYGDDGQQTLNDLAVDNAGNSYVVGSEGASSQSVFVLQYDSTGELRWRQPFVADGNSGSADVEAIAVQPTTGAVILAGFLNGSMTVGGLNLSSANDTNFGLPIPNLWLTALDKAGYVVWSKVFSSPAAVFPSQVFVTGSGDIEVTGTVRENATVGGGPLCCDGPDLGSTTFVARYSPTGDHLWSGAIGG